MKNNSTLIIGLMLVAVLVVSGCISKSEPECMSKLQEIEDVVSLSAGGFLSSDLCIFIVNGSKLHGEGSVCESQIGDKVYMSKYGLKPEWVCRL